MTLRALMVVAAFVLALTATRAEAYCRMGTATIASPDMSTCPRLASDNDHWLFWTHRCSELSISSAAPPHSLTIPQVQDVFRTAVATWAAVDCGSGLDLSPRFSIDVLMDTNACTLAGHNRNGHNVNSIIFVQDEHEWTETLGYSAQAFAVTLAWHLATTGEIVDVDMEINEGRGTWTTCDSTGCVDMGVMCPVLGCGREGGPVDLQNVVTHELGHYFGLGHTTIDHSEATMFYSAQFGELTMRDLDTDDIAGICDIYPPGSLAESCDPSPAGGLSLDCQAHDCGCGVPGSGDRSDRSGWIALGLIALVLVVRRTSR